MPRNIPKIVGYLGPEYTYSHLAAKKVFQNVTNVKLKACDTIPDMIEYVENGVLDLAVVPFWNSYQSHVHEAQLELIKKNVLAVRIEILPIKICLFASTDDLSKIHYVLSNCNVFEQCKTKLQKYLPNAKTKSVTSTALAAKDVRRRKTMAGLGPEECAEHYDLKVLKRRMESLRNYTLFFVVKKMKGTPDGRFSLYSVKVNDSEKKTIDSAMSHKDFKAPQKWAFMYGSGNKKEYFFELEGRYSDLDMLSFYQNQHRNFRSLKLIGSYDKSINDYIKNKFAF